ncbi:hypothetical protein MKW98_001333 [Papaver atlanticum]|uniref:Exonuclease domain-containing protein n=1 Tax=Papaver atlanticum TaxID=357466 RepID=A0AAD4SUV8_9MAGN|nr:hypothetical protein MKW98_001333 [Papaver atlanticum]
MDKKLAAAEKKVLVHMVKMMQKKGKRGTKGYWKEFLNVHDLKMGDTIRDPSRRSIDDLVSFLTTFTEEEDIKFLEKALERGSNREAVIQLHKNASDIESSPQKLVVLTLEHPEYACNYTFPSDEEDWVITKLGKLSKAKESDKMVAIDCEMVLCEDGTEALVQVCVVDQNLEVKLDTLVKPNKPIVDYRSEITGITAKDLEGVTCSLADLQRSMKKLLSHGTILIGHSLNCDLRALKLDHARVIDTSLIFRCTDGTTRRKPSLCHLSKIVLGHDLREKGAPHNCLADARAAMKLVLAKLEKGFDEIISLDAKEVTGDDLLKLFVHRIPIRVTADELRKLFPEDSTVVLEPFYKPQAKQYYASAIFKDQQEVLATFESIEGEEGKDSHGLPQKFVTFQLKNGNFASVYVRKMVRDDHPLLDSSRKRRIQEVEDNNEESNKKQKTNKDNCVEHIKEIKSLEKQLEQKNKEVVNLHKIIAALIRKEGL